MVEILKEDCTLLTNIDVIYSRFLYLNRKDLEKKKLGANLSCSIPKEVSGQHQTLTST